jgi:hypothetical protein
MLTGYCPPLITLRGGTGDSAPAEPQNFYFLDNDFNDF